MKTVEGKSVKTVEGKSVKTRLTWGCHTRFASDGLEAGRAYSWVPIACTTIFMCVASETFYF